MRETIAVVVCLLLLLIALQTGLLRTGMDYEAAVKRGDTIQAANDSLTEEVTRLSASVSPRTASVTASAVPAGIGVGLPGRFGKIKSAVLTQMKDYSKSGAVEVSEKADSLIVRIPEQVLFSSGTSKMTRAGRDTLLAFARTLQGANDVALEVTGHCDSAKGGGATLAEHEALRERSLGRAKIVADFLERQGSLDPGQILAAGWGDYRPLAPNDKEARRTRNRRIELCLRPADPLALIQARQWVRIETAPAKRPTAPPARAEEPLGESESIGEEYLGQVDQDLFESGYEKPAGK